MCLMYVGPGLRPGHAERSSARFRRFDSLMAAFRETAEAAVST